MSKCHRIIRTAGLALLLLLHLGPLNAQVDETLSAEQLETQANLLISQGRYTEAAPFVDKVLQEIYLIQDKKLLQRISLQVQRLEILFGFCQMAAGQNEKAIQVFEKFASDHPKSNRLRQALSMKAYAQMASEDWAGTVTSLQELLDRYRVLPAERAETLLTIGKALNAQQKYTEAFTPIREPLVAAENPAVRMAAMSEMLRALTNLDNSKVLYELVVILQGRVSPARYSFSFNLQAIEAADKMLEEENYTDAFVLLKLCQDHEAIQEGLNELEVYLNQETKRLSQMNLMQSFQQVTSTARRLQVVAAEKQALATAEDYTEGLSLRIAQVLARMDRLYESFAAYLAFYERFPQSEHAPKALFGAASLAGELELYERALELGYLFLENYPDSEFTSQVTFTLAYTHKAADQLAEAIAVLEKGTKAGIYKTEEDKGHAYFLTGLCELFRDDYEKAATWFDRLRAEAPNSGSREDADYWTAYMNLGAGDFENAAKQFQEFVTAYPNGRYLEDATYRLPLATFGAENYKLAYDQVREFIRTHPSSALLGDAHNILGDICGALGKLDEAIESYKLVEHFTDDPNQTHTAVFSAAKVMETDQRWEKLISHLQQYLDRYGDDGRYSMAVYRMGAAFRQLDRVDDMLALYWKTFERFQNDPAAIGADFLLRDYVTGFPENEINKTLGALHAQREKAAQEVFDSLTEKEQEAKRRERDQRTPEEKKAEEKALADRAAKEFAEAESAAKNSLLAFLTEKLSALEETADSTAGLRLLWALHLAGDASRTPQSFTPEQIAAGSPATLVWMGKILAHGGDHKTAATAYRRVVDEFPETDWTANAMLLLGEMEFQQKNLDEALFRFNDLYENFPTSEVAGAAVVRIGDILTLQEKRPEAVETYESVVMAREWRGPLWPESLYKVGRCHMDMGDAEKAFAYFQRVYVLYGGHPAWVAKAYLDSGKCLIQLGREQEAATTFQEMLDNESLGDESETLEAAELMKSLPAPKNNATPTTNETNGN